MFLRNCDFLKKGVCSFKIQSCVLSVEECVSHKDYNSHKQLKIIQYRGGKKRLAASKEDIMKIIILKSC